MRFNSIDHGFCESVGETLPFPEIFNSYSSISMSIFGLIGLLQSLRYKRPYDLRLICGMLIVNGMGSFYYHYTQQLGWAIVDELSMMTSVILGLNSMYTLIINSLHLPVMPLRRLHLMVHNHIIYKGVLTIVLSFYFILTYSISIFEETRPMFPLLFAIPTLLLIPGGIYIYNTFYKNKHNGGDLFLRGLKCSLLAGLIWGSTEPLCQTYPFIKYFHTHVIWHLFISYGMYLLIMFILHFHLYVVDKRYYKIHTMFGIPYFEHK